MIKNILVVALTAALVGCSAKEQTTAQASEAKPLPKKAVSVVAQSLPPGHPPIDTARETPAAAPAAQTPGGRLTGRVVETMNAGGYTYLRLNTAAGDVWTAVPETTVRTGATVAVEPQMVAEKFASATLHRTFDKLVMGVLAEPGAQQTSASPMGSAAQHMASPVNAAGDVRVERAEGGLSVAETWARRNELKDKPVLIRGKVMKALGGIMGRNWIHLRDGSGSRSEGNDDITVTTQETAKVGDVITVSGVVHVNVDFGAGYVYPVIVENARLQK